MPKSIGISLLTVFQLALALIFQLGIAKLFGISKSADIYFASNSLNFLLVGVASSALNFGLTPEFIKLKETGDYKRLIQLSSSVLSLVCIFFFFAALLQAFYSNGIVRLLFPGFIDNDIVLAAKLLSMQAFISIVSVAIGVLNAVNYTFDRMYVTVVSPIIGGVIQLIFVVCTFEQFGIFSLVYSLALHQIIIFTMLGLKYFSHYTLSIVFDDNLRVVTRRMVPLTIASLFSKLDILVNRYFGSMLMAGTISMLHYTLLYVTTFSTIVEKGIAIVSLRKFSVLVLGNIEDFDSYFAKLFHRMVYVVSCFTIVLLLAAPIILDYAASGDYISMQQKLDFFTIIVCYLGVFVGGVLTTVIVNAFYAQGLTVVVSKISIVLQSIFFPVKIVAYYKFGILALPLTMSLQYLVALFCLTLLYHRTISIVNFSSLGISMFINVVTIAFAIMVATQLL